VRWPLNLKTSGIEKYDGSTNPTEWLEVNQLTIEADGGDSYVMANYLLVCQSVSARTWLLGLSAGAVRSCNNLCQLFTTIFCATCIGPGVNWDLASVIQKKRESLREFIHWFYNKRNIIPKVDDKSIVLFFKKRLKDSSLIYKLAMKNPRTPLTSTPWPRR
jgi:hypothetical protein